MHGKTGQRRATCGSRRATQSGSSRSFAVRLADDSPCAASPSAVRQRCNQWARVNDRACETTTRIPRFSRHLRKPTGMNRSPRQTIESHRHVWSRGSARQDRGQIAYGADRSLGVACMRFQFRIAADHLAKPELPLPRDQGRPLRRQFGACPLVVFSMRFVSPRPFGHNPSVEAIRRASRQFRQISRRAFW